MHINSEEDSKKNVYTRKIAYNKQDICFYETFVKCENMHVNTSENGTAAAECVSHGDCNPDDNGGDRSGERTI